MNYGNVKKGHIVPAVYLRNFASEGKIGVHLVKEKRKLERRVEKVAIRNRPYRRIRPDGTHIDDIEWSLAELEGLAAPVLREFDDRWPLGVEDKQKLAELFAYQLLRGPRFKAEHEASTDRFLAEYEPAEDIADVDPGHLETVDAMLRSDSYRLIRMMPMGVTLTSILLSTHWTLIEFASRVLATSDHPIVIWPGVDRLKPQAVPILGAGVLECIEYRLPLSPTRGLLMTWVDKPDDQNARVAGSHEHAMNFNTFTIANAEREWFFCPGTSPPRAAGLIRPLSPELVRGYSAERALRSKRRAEVSAHVKEKVGRDLSDREVLRVAVNAPGEGRDRAAD